MPPNRPRYPSGIDHLEWLTTDDGSLTLWNQQIQETYHSGCGAVAESLVVYLGNSGVFGRLQNGQATSVFEMGLGTCTNLLLTAALATSASAPLEYWAIENSLLPVEFILRLNIREHLDSILSQNFSRLTGGDELNARSFDSLEHVQQNLLANWPLSLHQVQLHNNTCHSHSDSLNQHESSNPEVFDIHLSDNCQLRLLAGDARKTDWAQLLKERQTRFDAVFFDAFSPETSPELWSEMMLSSMYQLLTDGGTLTSYCVKSSIRKTLASIGFEVQRMPGPALGKREVLRATRPTS